MMGESAHGAGVILTVLASSLDDAAVATSDHALIGAPTDATALEALADLVDVVTFDHELVDLEQVAALETSGATVRPNASALRYAVDKGYQRQQFSANAIAVPRFIVVESSNDPLVKPFLDFAQSVVVKAARGGYDGRGVRFPSSSEEALLDIDELADTTSVVVEERLDLVAELAQVVVRGINGDVVAYPLVTTVQSEGMCVEVRYPSTVDSEVATESQRLSRKIATLTGAVGVVAVEFFLTTNGLVVNEIALRPHNSAHWTIEGSTTSQFANHLLAVSGRALGPADAVVRTAVMVNVVGGDEPGSIESARSVTGAHVHDYGKPWRPGRKLGHVTVVGDDESSVHVTAWESARAYGTRTREQR